MNVKDFTLPRVPMVALCLFALCALTVPASALASGHHGTNAHGAKLVVKKKSKKKPKKKPATTVIVKCASVTVTCKGTPGATGPQGPAGANGANGSAVVLRARSTGSVAAIEETSGCSSILCVGGQNVPVNPSTWTQGPTEDDQMIGSITVSVPSEADCGAEDTSSKTLEAGRAEILVSVDGLIEGLAVGVGGTGPTTINTAIVFDLGIIDIEDPSGEVGSGFFIGNGGNQTHTVAVRAVDSCKKAQATISNVAVDVLASF
jgi:hypothetical protein